jgi:hypothetical protein
LFQDRNQGTGYQNQLAGAATAIPEGSHFPGNLSGGAQHEARKPRNALQPNLGQVELPKEHISP